MACSIGRRSSFGIESGMGCGQRSVGSAVAAVHVAATVAVYVVVVLLAVAPAPAQQATLDLLDGETLSDGGSLLTFGADYTRRDTRRRGSHRVDDPFDGEQEDWLGSFALHYG